MIDVINSTFSLSGLKYPQELNRIWRVLISSRSIINNPGTTNHKTGNPVPHYFIQQDAKHNPICLTYDPVMGLTSCDEEFPLKQRKEPYNFAVPAKIEEEAVMFIGMNPSYIPSIENNNGVIPYIKYWNGTLINPDLTTGWQFEEFYDPDSIFCKSTYFEDLRKLTTAFYIAQNNGRTNYMTGSDTSSEKDGEVKYNKCIEGKRIPNYAHLDLLAIRHTTQRDIEDALKYYYNKDKDFTDFINAQINIFKDLLQAAKPKVIIVNSGLASNILRNNGVFFQDNTLSKTNNTDIWKDLRTHLNMQLSWDDNISAYRWVNPTFNKEREVNNEKAIPVFLCGMTSGQRALDSGRREELIAQVAKVI